jgi:hypothetical protein
MKPGYVHYRMILMLPIRVEARSERHTESRIGGNELFVLRHSYRALVDVIAGEMHSVARVVRPIIVTHKKWSRWDIDHLCTVYYIDLHRGMLNGMRRG